MADTFLTYQDAYEHLLDVFHQVGKDAGIQKRRLRRAIVEAYHLLPSLHDWEYYRGTGSIVTTVPETHAGTYTAADNRITITGTWTTEAIHGSVLVSDVRYPVKRRVSATVIELDGGPGADVTSTFRWQRFKYLLPQDVGGISNVLDPSTQFFEVKRVEPSRTFWWQEVINAETYPLAWSIFKSDLYPGRLEMWLSGSGVIQRTLRYMYRRRHTSLNTLELKGGTVSTVGDVATFSTAILTSAHVGAALRVSGDANPPTSDYGYESRDVVTGEESETLNPSASTHVIEEITSTTVAVLRTPPAADITTMGYTISSLIDVNYEGMQELFYRLAEEQYDIITRAESPIRNMSYASRMRAMREAMIADGPRTTVMSNTSWRGKIILEDS